MWRPCQVQAVHRALDDFSEYELFEDGSVLVVGEFVQGDWLTDMLLGYGEYCEIMEPEWLWEEVREKLRKLVEKYALR